MQQNPNDIEILEQLAEKTMATIASEHTTNKIKAMYQSFIDKNPNNFDYKCEYGELLINLFNTNEARVYYQDLLKQYPNRYRAYSGLAGSYLIDNDVINAEKTLLDSLKGLKNEHAKVYNGLGEIYKYQYNANVYPSNIHNEVEMSLFITPDKLPELRLKEIEAYKKAVEIDPKFIDPIYELAGLYYQDNDYTNSLKYYNKFLKLHDKNCNNCVVKEVKNKVDFLRVKLAPNKELSKKDTAILNANYMNKFKQQLYMHWTPPEDDKSKVTIFELRIRRDGRMISQKMVKSSGDTAFDVTTYWTLERNTQFDAFPKECKAEFVDVEFKFEKK